MAISIGTKATTSNAQRSFRQFAAQKVFLFMQDRYEDWDDQELKDWYNENANVYDPEDPEAFIYDPELLAEWYWEQFEEEMLRQCYR